MANKIPCTLIRDLAPLYAEALVSDETRKLVEEHLEECEECRQYCSRMTEEMECGKMSKEQQEMMEIDYMKKIHAYQRSNTILGAVVSLLLGLFLPLVIVGISVLSRGGIPDYYLARLQIAWPLGLLQMLVSGIVVCVLYLILNRCFQKKRVTDK